MRPRLVVIVGPTGSGKSALALDVAERANADIVSADSQQVYRGMDIGTGKLRLDQRRGIRHHLIDVLEPDQDMTAARFAQLADAAIADAAARGAPVVVAGGTMLYVRALLTGLFEGPGRDEPLRDRLRAVASDSGVAELHRRLAEVDPTSAERIDPTDERRIVRALEVYELTGEPLSVHHERHRTETATPRYPASVVGIAPERDQLYRRIDDRVDEMVAAGLVDEVRALRAAGYAGCRSQAAIGYAELHQHLDGTVSLDEAIRLIKRNSRRYARRQTSWYRGDESVRWYPDRSAVDLPALERYLRAPESSGE